MGREKTRAEFLLLNDTLGKRFFQSIKEILKLFKTKLLFNDMID